MLAAVVTLAGAGAPAAYGFDNRPAVGVGQSTTAQVHHYPLDSTDWVLLGVVVASGITLAGVGLGASEAFARAPETPHGARPSAGGS
jgi:hypothetical protein